MIGWYGLARSGSEYGLVEGCCEHFDETLGSINCWEVHEQLHNWQLVEKCSSP
jgi:hypothetical protein